MAVQVRFRTETEPQPILLHAWRSWTQPPCPYQMWGVAYVYIQACLSGDSLQSDPMPHWVTSRQQLHYISVSTVVNEASTYYLK